MIRRLVTMSLRPVRAKRLMRYRAADVRTYAVRHTLRLLCRPAVSLRLERVGSQYGGWVIPTDQLKPGAVCYCAGAGEDISFDLELVQRFGCEVYTIDPTPRAQRHVASVAGNLRGLHYIPLGLWSSKQRVRFYSPRNPEHVSYSIVNLQGTRDYIEAECTTVADLMAHHGHEELDLLKMDVEGAEYEVLENLLASDVEVGILCVEFDQPSPIHRTTRMVSKLNNAGYKLANVDSFNFTFLKEDRFERLHPTKR